MSKISKFISGKGFYFVLAFCLIAVGAAGFLAVSSSKISEEPEKNENVSSNSSIVYSEPEKTENKTESEAVQKAVSDEPKTSSVKEEKKIPVAESFGLPTSGAKIIKGFDSKNLQFSSTYGDMRIHLGTDIEAQNGEDVKSCGDGTVKKIYSDDTLGRIIEIDHGNGVVIKYCGLADNVCVKQDYTVKKGEKIGTLSGTPSESMDTPHIHIEATISGKHTDPAKILKID
ncbi:MAG: M23 family metallopeptidase [Clostridiales bacterium]|nr:M23 family metallopeptidase [Candidatus Equinaster intestinalis]